MENSRKKITQWRFLYSYRQVNYIRLWGHRRLDSSNWIEVCSWCLGLMSYRFINYAEEERSLHLPCLEIPEPWGNQAAKHQQLTKVTHDTHMAEQRAEKEKAQITELEEAPNTKYMLKLMKIFWYTCLIWEKGKEKA